MVPGSQTRVEERGHSLPVLVLRGDGNLRCQGWLEERQDRAPEACAGLRVSWAWGEVSPHPRADGCRARCPAAPAPFGLYKPCRSLTAPCVGIEGWAESWWVLWLRFRCRAVEISSGCAPSARAHERARSLGKSAALLGAEARRVGGEGTVCPVTWHADCRARVTTRVLTARSARVRSRNFPSNTSLVTSEVLKSISQTGQTRDAYLHSVSTLVNNWQQDLSPGSWWCKRVSFQVRRWGA